MKFRGYFNVAITNIKHSDLFQKIVYRLYDRSTKKPIDLPVFIHYLGTQNIDQLNSLKPTAHGNTKDKTNANGFARTLPSVLNKLNHK